MIQLTSIIRRQAGVLVGVLKIPVKIVDKNGFTRNFHKSVLPDTNAGSSNTHGMNTGDHVFFKPDYFSSAKHHNNLKFINALVEAVYEVTVCIFLIVPSSMIILNWH
jgi:hypothetical protein